MLLITAGAVAAADAARAMSVTVPKRPLEATVASVPWAALLIGLTLLYAMGRQALPSRRAAAIGYAPANGGGPVTQRPGLAEVPLSALLDHRPARPATIPDRAMVSAPTAATQPAAAPERAAAPGLAPVSEPDTPTPQRDDPSDPDASAADQAASPASARDRPTRDQQAEDQPPGD